MEFHWKILGMVILILILRKGGREKGESCLEILSFSILIQNFHIETGMLKIWWKLCMQRMHLILEPRVMVCKDA